MKKSVASPGNRDLGSAPTPPLSPLSRRRICRHLLSTTPDSEAHSAPLFADKSALLWVVLRVVATGVIYPCPDVRYHAGCVIHLQKKVHAFIGTPAARNVCACVVYLDVCGCVLCVRTGVRVCCVCVGVRVAHV